jgi:septal ring factor EnvC (AmiA/AmiB activator)
MKTLIDVLKFFKTIFVDSLNNLKSPFLISVRNVFSWIGLVLVLYVVHLTFYSKPIEVSQQEEVVDSLVTQIEKNKKLLSKLEGDNKKLEEDILKLRQELDKSENKSEKYKKQYESQMDYINSLSNSELTKLFTKEFSKK